MQKNLLVKNILVIDLELNQPSERIIELGYVIGNPKSSELIRRNSVLVNPYELLSNEIINLTGISQAMVDVGNNLQFAYDTMVHDALRYEAIPIIHQWGVGDMLLLQHQLDDEIDWIFGRRFIDIKSLSQAHSIIHGVNCYGGLRKMAARLGIKMSREKQHRADYDAEIAFLLYSKLSHLLLHSPH